MPLEIELAGALHPFDQDSVVVGRAPDCDLVVDATHEQVSGRHLRVAVEDGGIVVQDLGSTNGSRLGEVPLVGSARLEPGQTVQLGRKGPRLTARPVDRAQTVIGGQRGRRRPARAAVVEGVEPPTADQRSELAAEAAERPRRRGSGGMRAVDLTESAPADRPRAGARSGWLVAGLAVVAAVASHLVPWPAEDAVGAQEAVGGPSADRDRPAPDGAGPATAAPDRSRHAIARARVAAVASTLFDEERTRRYGAALERMETHLDALRRLEPGEDDGAGRATDDGDRDAIERERSAMVALNAQLLAAADPPLEDLARSVEPALFRVVLTHHDLAGSVLARRTGTAWVVDADGWLATSADLARATEPRHGPPGTRWTAALVVQAGTGRSFEVTQVVAPPADGPDRAVALLAIEPGDAALVALDVAWTPGAALPRPGAPVRVAAVIGENEAPEVSIVPGFVHRLDGGEPGSAAAFASLAHTGLAARSTRGAPLIDAAGAVVAIDGSWSPSEVGTAVPSVADLGRASALDGLAELLADAR